jgi:hypothetical protein
MGCGLDEVGLNVSSYAHNKRGNMKKEHKGQQEMPVKRDNKEFVFDKVLFDTDALSAMESILNSSAGSNSASVKFMITIQDKADLENLGYSKEQIDKLKPQEASDIIKSGTKFEPQVN